ncbi:MAG: hypothetical protein ACREBJ_10345 [Nitrosotalea sp.]
MGLLVNALNRQIDQTIHANPSPANKLQLGATCGLFKKAAIVTAVATPIFAFFLPVAFSLIVCLTTAILGYEVFNIADNLGDMAKQSADGIRPNLSKTNTEVLLEDTLLTAALYRKYLAPASKFEGLPVIPDKN